MPSWRLAKSLMRLRDQINELYPSRNKVSDGTIADFAHSQRVSDHNPDSQGRVTAMDITNDPAHGVDGRELANRLTTDDRVKYVIFAGKIWKARNQQWGDYHGVSPHEHHVHVSVKQENADDEKPWVLNGSKEKQDEW